ncbi:MAG: hypothetical protein ACFFBR_09190 [Promethearchaeota archaeon]
MLIPELIFAGISFLIIWIFGSIILWLAGKVVSGYNAKFTDALWISLIGAIIQTLLGLAMTFFVIPLLPAGLLGLILGTVVPLIIVLIVYIWLIMHFFDTGFLGALAVGILYFIFMIIIGIVLIIIGAILLVFLIMIFGP